MVFQLAIAVEQSVQDLQNRVGNLMIAVVDRVIPKPDDIGDMAQVSRAAEGMERDIEDLKRQVFDTFCICVAHPKFVLRTLESISQSLSEINAQTRFLLSSKICISPRSTIVLLVLPLLWRNSMCVYPTQICFHIIQIAEKVRNDLRTSNTLQDIQIRLLKIQNLTQRVAERVEDLHTDFKQLLNNLNTTAHADRTTLVRHPMPENTRVFYGRDNLVIEVSQLLCDEKTSRVCVLGPGGMGKTSVALAVVYSSIVQTRYATRCFWVPCAEASSPALFLQLLHNQLRIGRSTDNIMDDILSELNISKAPRLLLLDNFETTWNPTVGTQKEANDILCRLGQLSHVAILMTKRGTEPPCDDINWQPKQLGALDKDSSRTIFHEVYPKSIPDPDVDSLLAALGHMSFAVTLMAKLGKKSRSLARELHGKWSEVGTDMLSHSSSPENNMNRSISLSVDRDFV